MNVFCGPMSKLIVDCILESNNAGNRPIALIPSRRQVDAEGGYVNDWTTAAFASYVKTRSPTTQLERDHGGPGQGYGSEDKYLDSFVEDCKYFDLIHIDPWKQFPKYEDGLAETIRLLEFCYAQNSTIRYEIGTEEGIRPFTVEEVDRLATDVKRSVLPEVFAQIQYLVIQCGTKLCSHENIGVFDADLCSQMLAVTEKHGLKAKEHNGDWISTFVKRAKKDLGLQNINIAPELGTLETTVLLDQLNEEDTETFFQLCFASNRWCKWVSADFRPHEQKRDLMLICGHYLFSHPDVISMKARYPHIESRICEAIRTRLTEYLSV